MLYDTCCLYRVLWLGFVACFVLCCVCVIGTRRLIPESHSEVNIHDGDDGGIVLDIYRQKHRGLKACPYMLIALGKWIFKLGFSGVL